jgi:hypothetical protein
MHGGVVGLRGMRHGVADQEPEAHVVGRFGHVRFAEYALRYEVLELGEIASPKVARVFERL